ncbi:MAG: phage tail tape measure protein [Lachnospiraceae bacterium]|nr:phage tail tape measure protein [Lachnospiraceae bacterium]
MAGKIRGITIELSADASGVLKAVESVNKKIKSTSSSLKDVDKLLKMDPTNTTLLTQKTQLLQEQISNTKDKLEQLKAAQADMDANGVDKNSAQYQALQREIIATEQELQKLENTTGSGSAALAKISAVTGQWGEKMEEVGKKMSILSAGLVALGAAALKSFNEVDEGMDTIIKKTGATGEAAEDMEEVYRSIAQGMVADFTDIGSAVGEVNTRFGLTGDDLEDLSTKFLKFADINGTDVSNSVDSVQKALSAFGLDASNAGDLLDRMTAVAQDTGVSVDTLSSGLVQNGTAFEQMGLNIDQATILMGQMEKSGANSETVMNGLRKALKNATEDGIPLNEALSDLQDTILNGKDGVDGLTAAYDLFGKSGDQIYGAVKNGTLNFADLAIAVTDVSGAVEDTYEATLDGTDKMKLAWQNMQLGLADLGGAIGETLAPIMDKITAAIQKVVDWFSNLDDGTKELIVTIGLIVAAVGPLLVVGGKIMQGISSITGALSKIGTATAGPIGLAIAAVAALTAATSALINGWHDAYKESSPFTEALEDIAAKNDELSTSIANTKQSYEDTVGASEANAAAAEYLYGKLQDLIAGYDGTAGSASAIEGVVSQLNELVPGLGLSWDSVTNSLNLTNAEIYANIEAMKAQAQVAALQDMYTDSLKQQYEAQKNLTESAKTLKGVLDQHGVSLEEVFSIMGDGNITTAEAINFLTSHGIALEDATGYTEELCTALSEYMQARQNQADADENVTFAEDELGKAMENAAATTAAAKEEILNSTNEINEGVNFDPAVEAASTAGEEIPAEFASGVEAGTPDVETAASDMAQAVVDEVAETPAEMYSTGSDAGSQMDTGLQEQLDPIKNTIQTMASYFGTETAQIGMGMYNLAITAITGFATAIANTTASQVVPAIQGLVSGIATSMSSLPNQMYSVGDQAGSGLYNGLAAWAGTLSSMAWNLAYSIQSAARAALQIRSPSRVMERIGMYTGEGLQEGLEESASGIYRTAEHIANATAASMTPTLDGMTALNTMTNTAAARPMAEQSNNLTLNSVLSILSQYLPHLADQTDIVLDDGTLVGHMMPMIDRELEIRSVRAGRG